jgi:hypothetical protein
MIRTRYFAVLAILAAGVFSLSRIARAGEEAPTAPATETAKPAAEAPKASEPAKTDATKTVEAPATKTPTPMHSLMGWIGKQVAPNLDCPCPGTADGEKAWRTWFAGGKDVPLASLRDRMVADGWTADSFVTFFKAKADCKGDCAKGDCAKGDCAKGDCKGDCAKKDGCCQGKGERADGKGCCGKCKDKAKTDSPEAKPAPAPAEAPVAKP